jgi:hypothetical protein
MANSPDTVDSWPGLLGQLNKTFLLIRDIFGYALPGAVFLAIGLISGRFSLVNLRSLLHPYEPPAWALFLFSIIACYAVGEILASTAYMPIALRKRWQWLQLKRYLYPPKGETPNDAQKAEIEKQIYILQDNPTEVTGELLEIRRQHPEFFVESDRRETLMLLGGSMTVALLGGWLVFYALALKPSVIFLGAGIILLIQFSTGPSHLRRVRAAIREAAKAAHPPPKPDPDFPHLLADLITATTDALKK